MRYSTLAFSLDVFNADFCRHLKTALRLSIVSSTVKDAVAVSTYCVHLSAVTTEFRDSLTVELNALTDLLRT